MTTGSAGAAPVRSTPADDADPFSPSDPDIVERRARVERTAPFPFLESGTRHD